MRIALIFDGLQIGGIERVGADYAKLIQELGHNVYIVNLNPSLKDMDSEFPNECKRIDIRFPRKICPEQYAQLIKTSYIGRFIYPIMSIVLSFFIILYRFLVHFRLRKEKTFDLAIAFSGHFNDLSFVAYDMINSRTKLCWLHGALYSYILTSDGFLNLYRKIKKLVVLVDDAQEEALTYNHISDLKIYKIYNPTSISDHKVDDNKVKSLSEKYGKFAVMVSRFKYPHKDQFTVAESIRILKEKYNVDLNLVFVGDGPDKDNVINFVNSFDNDTRSHIFFEGSQTDVQNYYSSAYILLHASVAGEGLPTVMIESLSYDLPMVVTDSKTGPREILGNNEYGLLCKIKDPSDMAEKIYSLISNNDLYMEYKNKSKKRLNDFLPSTIKGKLSYLLQDVMH